MLGDLFLSVEGSESPTQGVETRMRPALTNAAGRCDITVQAPGPEVKHDVLVIHDVVDLMALGKGHLLQQGHQLRIPVQDQSMTLSYDCSSSTDVCQEGMQLCVQYFLV